MECRCAFEIPNRLPLPAWRARICARGDLRAPLAGEGYVGWLWYWVSQTSRDNRPARPGSGRRRNSHPSCADRESPRLAYPSVCLRAPWCEPALSAAPTGTESGLAGGCAFRGPASSPEVTLHSQGCPRSSRDRKSTRLNSSHLVISYAVFCLKKKKKNRKNQGLKKIEQ